MTCHVIQRKAKCNAQSMRRDAMRGDSNATQRIVTRRDAAPNAR